MSIQTLLREIRNENALFSRGYKSDKEVLHVVPLLISKYFRTGMIQLLLEFKNWEFLRRFVIFHQSNNLTFKRRNNNR